MSETPPTVYLFYGDDPTAIEDSVERLKSKMGDSGTASLNIDHVDAATCELEHLASICNAVPFLSRRRLVIAEEPTLWMSAEARMDRFFELLLHLPQSTALLLIQPVDLRASRGKLPAKAKTLVRWLEEEHPAAYLQRYKMPQGGAFVHWLGQRAQAHGGQITREAAQLLAEWVGEDSLLADQELLKLLDYVDRVRPIEIRDVEALTPFHGQTDIFEMVDALGQRDAPRALRTLRLLLDSEPHGYLFAMVARQFRLLLLAREALDRGQDPRQALDLHPYVAKKVTDQARNFDVSDLERIYRHLLELDVASKSGGADLEVSLEHLTATLAR
jgi:DNA polymerase-3 subunit delta